MSTSLTRPLPPTTVLPDFEDVDFSGLSIPIFTIYNNTADFPGKFVVRLWDLDVPTPYVCLFATIADARKSVPESFIMLARHPSDDPVIVETWV